ncbi:MAG: N-acetyl-gamma-glutamyl-phosphate reductase [Synergistaceae bacterium]|nr:N-acetyl-gamma-glutamyl-phosphate reductase [Synergistaceae bacterium]
MKKVFIDGSAGTTGLRIYERLSSRKDIQLLTLTEETRKDINARSDALNQADIAFLCLPDDAAKESVSLVSNPNTAVIDTSTAHRVNPDWVYGLPELKGQRLRVANSKRIANPGCHATGFIALVAPLVESGLVNPQTGLSCFSLTGYSGGGKKMIAQYEDDNRNKLLDAPRQYGLTQNHKHLPEMTQVSGLNVPPVFCPIVAPYYAGMEVTVSLNNADVKTVKECYRDYYHDGVIYFSDSDDFAETGFISAGAFAGRDDLEITVHGNSERLLLVSRFDNLGKGASGAAIQNMNILLGLDETTGLNVRR